MKISQMLEREDFYEINKHTLDAFYIGGEGKTSLYIYPKLNAIITKSPSKSVRDYLLCEYSVRSNIAKKILVSVYVRSCLLTKGLMADKKIDVNATINSNTLIYPCNKKYRIFDFANQTVDVIIKNGFSDSDLKHEIEFRKKKDLPSFVPGLVSCSSCGYKEVIINGKPLARLSNGFEKYRDTAYSLLCDYRKQQTVKINGKKYQKKLKEKIDGLTTNKVKQKSLLEKVVLKLLSVQIEDEISTTFSHGDLQAGNIWIENNTGKIFIIDWESWAIRSCWYDKATLYDDLRPGGLDAYFIREIKLTERVIVLLEDIIFQLTELNNLPESYGEDQFERYLSQMNSHIDRMEHINAL